MQFLREFLSQHKATSESNVTSLDGKWGGKWLIPMEDYSKFLTLYYDACKADNLKLVEKKQNSTENFYMLADIDISKEDIASVYANVLPPKFLATIVETYRETLRDIIVDVILDEDITPIITCRMKQPTKLHLNWPKIVVNNIRGKYIRDAVVKNITAKLAGDWNKWLDGAVYTGTGLRLLGSVKPREARDNRYYVVSGFSDQNSPLNPTIELLLDDIKNTSIRVLSEKVELTDFKPNHVLPEKKPIVIIKKDTDALIQVSNEHSLTKSEKGITDTERKLVEQGFIRSWTNEHYDPEMLKSFALSEIRRSGDYYFMQNKSRINCLFKGLPHNRSSYCHYHTLCPDGTYIACHDELCKGKRYPDPPIPLPTDIKQYLFINNGVINNGNGNTTVINDLTNNSMVKLDFASDITDIKLFDDNKSNLILLNSLNGRDDPMASLLYIIARDRFSFTKESGWWFWKGVQWRKGGTSELTSILRDDINDLLLQVKQLYKSQSQKREIKDYDKKMLQIDRVCDRLCSREYKQKIIGEAEWIFDSNCDQKNFEARLDNSDYLIGFMNGVYDLSTSTFRDGKPEDYISITTGYDFVPESEIDPKDGVALQDFIENIMPDKDDRNYLLKLLSSGLLGRHPDELFHIFTGGGRNGKSKLAELIKLTLGDYFQTISSIFLTSKMTGVEQAKPQLMSLEKARLVIGSEPDSSSKLNASVIKGISGNDDITGRQLYGVQKRYKPKFKMILLCNNIPDIDSSDGAIWTRCRCIDFPTKFVTNPINAQEKLIDMHLSVKLPRWRVPFLHILLRYYSIYLTEGLEMTPNMVKRTKEYQSDSDMFLYWLNERTQPATSNTHMSVLYNDFKGWYVSFYPGKKLPSSLEFVRGVKVYKEVKRTVWSNGSAKQGIAHLILKSELMGSDQDTNESDGSVQTQSHV